MDEGVGGNSSIKGKVVIHYYNDDYSLLLTSKPAPEEDVYIVYGDNHSIGDNTETNFNGLFEFKYLYPGKYTVYAYSDDSLNIDPGNKIAVYKEVEIKDRKQDLDIGDINIVESVNYDDGNASISGRIYLINYYKESEWPHMIVKDTSYAQELEVYIKYGDHEFYDDRIRTQYDGTFVFDELIKGEYLIFVYSQDLTGATQNEVIFREVKIENEFDNIKVEDIYVRKI